MRTFSPAVPEDLAWQLQILQVAGHLKARSQYWGLHHLNSTDFINSQIHGMIGEMSGTKSTKFTSFKVTKHCYRILPLDSVLKGLNLQNKESFII